VAAHARRTLLMAAVLSLIAVWLFALGLAHQGSEAAAQATISERVSDASRKPGTPVVIGVLGEPIPLSIDELTNQSDLVVEARVSRLKTYVDEQDTAVLTDFALMPVRILAGTVPDAGSTPSVTPPLVLSTYGGEVVRKGVTVRAVNHDREQLEHGRVYLLFLKRFGEERGVYQIFNAAAFEVSGGAIRPLARQATDLYRDFSADYAHVVTRIVAAERAR
jgi:hypothetical protein